MTKIELAEVFSTLVKRLESRIKWHNDGYYDDDSACAKNAAVRDVLDSLSREFQDIADSLLTD